jgi:hypothetical protein
MAFFDFDFIENFFFVSLGITFVLIILLVYHFKQRITSMERKGDTMYELITNVVKELQFMKKLNAYYETLFQNTTSPVDDNSPEENSLSPTPSGLVTDLSNSCLVKEVTTDNIRLNLVDKTPSAEGSSSKDNQKLHENSRIVVSEDESSVSDNESESDDTDLNYSTDDEESDEDDTENNTGLPNENEVLKSIANNTDESVQQFTYETPNGVSQGISQTPVEMNHLMKMIHKAFENGISPQEPQKFAPYYEPELEETTSYKPVVIHAEEQITDEPIVDILLSEDGFPSTDKLVPGIPQSMNSDSVMQELDITELDEFAQHPEESNILEVETLDNSVIENEHIVAENTFSVEDKSSSVEQIQAPVLPIDKKQTREVYRKMNITQLRGIATAAGIIVDTTKMKKNELIHLLENLEE